MEEKEETGLKSGNGQDPLAKNDNSPPDGPELEPRSKRQKHPPAVLTYNTLTNPTYETQAAAHFIASNNVFGSQLPQCGTPHLNWKAGLLTVQQFQLPSYPPLPQYPVILGTYLQYPSMPQAVFQPVNQFPVPSLIMYQPKSDLMQVPVTMNSRHIPVPDYVF